MNAGYILILDFQMNMLPLEAIDENYPCLAKTFPNELSFAICLTACRLFLLVGCSSLCHATKACFLFYFSWGGQDVKNKFDIAFVTVINMSKYMSFT